MPHPEAPQPDELPDGVPGPPSPAPDRDETGKLRPGPGTSALARRAAQARHEAAAIGRLAGLWEAPEGHPFRPYQRLAHEWRERHLAELAERVGGGRCGSGPASIVASASIQLAASRYLHDLGAQTGDAKMLIDASKLADASRQNLISAHHLCAKQAEKPQIPTDFPWLQATDEDPTP